MIVVALNGSPNKEGNTSFLLSKTLESSRNAGAEETIMFHVAELLEELKNPFCTVCSNPCSGVCYRGSRLEEVFEKLAEADAIVVGSPTYFGSISGQLKAFFDKTRKLRVEKKLYNKVVAGITVGASRFGGQETTMKALHDLFLVQGMMVVGDGYVEDDCGHSGACGQRPAQNDEYAIKRAEIIGKRLVEVARKLK